MPTPMTNTTPNRPNSHMSNIPLPFQPPNKINNVYSPSPSAHSTISEDLSKDDLQKSKNKRQKQPNENNLKNPEDPKTSSMMDKKIKIRDTKKVPSKFNPLMDPKDEPGRVNFIEKIYQMSVERGNPYKSIPMMKQKPLDIFSIYKAVKELGGVERVEHEKLWSKVIEKQRDQGKINFINDGPTINTTTCQAVKKAYCRYIIDFEAKYDLNVDADILLQKIDGKRLPPKKGKDEMEPNPSGADRSRLGIMKSNFEEDPNEASNHSSISHTNSLSGLPNHFNQNSHSQHSHQSGLSNPPSVPPMRHPGQPQHDHPGMSQVQNSHLHPGIYNSPISTPQPTPPPQRKKPGPKPKNKTEDKSSQDGSNKPPNVHAQHPSSIRHPGPHQPPMGHPGHPGMPRMPGNHLPGYPHNYQHQMHQHMHRPAYPGQNHYGHPMGAHMMGLPGQPPNKMPRMEHPGRPGAVGQMPASATAAAQPTKPIIAPPSPPKSPSDLVIQKCMKSQSDTQNLINETKKDPSKIENVQIDHFDSSSQKFNAKDLNTQPQLAPSGQIIPGNSLGVDCFRLTMALKSQIPEEITWAIEMLTVLTADDSTIRLFNFSQQHDLFKAISELYKTALVDFVEIWEKDLENKRKFNCQTKKEMKEVDIKQETHSPDNTVPASSSSTSSKKIKIENLESSLLEHRGLHLKSVNKAKFGPNHDYKIIKASDQNIINRTDFWDQLDPSSKISRITGSIDKYATPLQLFGEKVTVNFDTSAVTPFSNILSSSGSNSSSSSKNQHKSDKDSKNNRDKDSDKHDDKNDEKSTFIQRCNLFFNDAKYDTNSNFRKYRNEKAIITKTSRIFNPFSNKRTYPKGAEKDDCERTLDSDGFAIPKRPRSKSPDSDPENPTSQHPEFKAAPIPPPTPAYSEQMVAKKYENFYENDLVLKTKYLLNKNLDAGYDSESFCSELNVSKGAIIEADVEVEGDIVSSDEENHNQHQTGNQQEKDLKSSTHNPTTLSLADTKIKSHHCHLPTFSPSKISLCSDLSTNHLKFDISYRPSILNSFYPENSIEKSKIFKILAISNIIKSLSCVPDNRFFYASDMSMVNLFILTVKRKFDKTVIIREEQSRKTENRQPSKKEASDEEKEERTDRPEKQPKSPSNQPPSESSSHDSGMDDKNLDETEDNNKDQNNTSSSESKELLQNQVAAKKLIILDSYKNFRVSPNIFFVNSEVENDCVVILNNLGLREHFEFMTHEI